MKRYINPSRDEWKSLCLRPSSYNPVVEERVKGIVEMVKQEGDEALRKLSREIDGVDLQSIAVTKEEIEMACECVSDEIKEAIQNAISNITSFHKAQIPSHVVCDTAPGVRCIQKIVPIKSVGIYIPGGTAPLFSTVLMLAIPAKLAKCLRVVMCTPMAKQISNEVLYAASMCGVDEIYRIGGAQAIAAMAYGTQTVAKVDKILGPGNQYVTTAKQMVAADVCAIDMPAGPSEVMVIADSNADISYISADLLSQAEHGADSQVMLLCDDEKMIEKLMQEIDRQCNKLPRFEAARKSLENSCAIVFSDVKDLIDFANEYAPEHLIINREDAWEICDAIYAAGSVFVGAYTPESAGDYASGTNHTLPTCGWARSFSGVNMDSFLRKMTIQEISQEGLQSLSSTIITMAEAEGLEAHANAVRVRIKNE